MALLLQALTHGTVFELKALIHGTAFELEALTHGTVFDLKALTHGTVFALKALTHVVVVAGSDACKPVQVLPASGIKSELLESLQPIVNICPQIQLKFIRKDLLFDISCNLR